MKSFIEFLSEQNRAYSNEWGWFKSDGHYVDGKADGVAKTHRDLLPDKIMGESDFDNRKAFMAGWLRYCQNKEGSGYTVNIVFSERSMGLRLLRHAMKMNPKLFPEHEKYRFYFANDGKSIVGDSLGEFLDWTDSI